MNSFLRIACLLIFATAGVFAAVGLAITLRPANAASAQDDSSEEPRARDVAVLPAPQLETPPLVAPAQAPAAPAPIIAPAQPPVAQDKNDLSNLEVLERLQTQLHRTLEAQEAFANQQAARAAAAAALPPAPAPTPLPVPAAMPAPVSRAAEEQEDDADQEEDERSSGKPQRSSSPRARASVEGEGDDHLSINIQNTDIREVLDLLSQQGGMNILPSPSVQGTVTASLHDVSLDTALAAILRSTGFQARREGRFIYVGTAEDFKLQLRADDTIGTRVYRPYYARAADLQALIQPLLTTEGAVSVTTSPAEVGIGTDGDRAGGDSFAGSDAIVVRDYETVLARIDQVVAEIDRKPLQVAIEAMILSVSLNDENQMGVDFQLLRNQRHVRISSGSPLTDLGGVETGDSRMKFGFLDSSLGAFLNALESIGETSVIATPRLMCLNKHRAEILIGQQLGYISTTVTETSTSQSVDFLEVGTQLRLRPFISADGMIRMEVHPELSTGTVELKGDFTLPEKEVTQVTTNIMVPDGNTMIIGGLMREDLDNTSSQLPVLGNMPGLGFLFRQKKTTNRRSEILVLITPHIICESEACREGDHAACEFHRRQQHMADTMAPIGRAYIARKYYRMAQEAWVACDREAALENLDLSLRINPVDRSALELRDQIRHGVRPSMCSPSSCPPPGHGPLVSEPTHLSPPTEELPEWILDDLSSETSATPAAPFEPVQGSAAPAELPPAPLPEELLP